MPISTSVQIISSRGGVFPCMKSDTRLKLSPILVATWKVRGSCRVRYSHAINHRSSLSHKILDILYHAPLFNMSSIAEDTTSCLHALHTLAATLPAASEEYRTEMPVKKVIDERDRLKIWAGSLGALQTGTKALAFRLRESPIMENNVKKLLRRLVNILTECKPALLHIQTKVHSTDLHDRFRNHNWGQSSA
jgi:hypothetical protein